LSHKGFRLKSVFEDFADIGRQMERHLTPNGFWNVVEVIFVARG
jgi:hypothetical protein